MKFVFDLKNHAKKYLQGNTNNGRLAESIFILIEVLEEIQDQINILNERLTRMENE